MKSRLYLLALGALLLLQAGCYTSDKLNQLQLGMSRAQVTGLMGEPSSTTRQANVEYLTYYLTNSESGLSADVLGSLRVGMSRDQVIALIGRPDSTSAAGNVVYLTYNLLTNNSIERVRPYVVRLVGNKTESFGRLLQLADIYGRPVTDEVPGQGEFPSGVPPGVAETSEGAPDPHRYNAARGYPYMVRLVGGQVDSFGRIGLLDDLQLRPLTSAYPGEREFPTMGVAVGIIPGSMAAPPPPPEFDLAAKIETLESLKEEGVLSPAEFTAAKARLLAP